ncbi:hypothetical protein N9K28_02360 [Candidatus Pelagibacter sp.]|nr:hypothetical protein [Candidatus Pelagibacter sp.]
MSTEKVNSIADISKVVNLRPYFKRKKPEVKDRIPLATLEKIEEISSSSQIVYINTIFNRKRKIKISGRTDINIILNRIKKVKKKEILTNHVYGFTSCLIIVAGIILSF